MRFIILITLAFICFNVKAQSENDKELFSEGEYFFNREDYSEAAFYFKQLVTKEPGNCHYNFRLGECYMNLPGSEGYAVPYFEASVRRTVGKKKYNYGSSSEVFAPLHAWFYLGNVYRITGRLNDALKAYDSFMNSTDYEGNYNIIVVENEVKSCERAKIIMDSPIEADIQPLDTLLNTQDAEFYPVVTPDESTIAFVRRLKFYDAILMVSKQGNKWGTPVNMNPLIGSDGEYYPVSFSPDGNALFLMRDKGGNKDLYVSYKSNNQWSKAVSLGDKVNTIANETWASLSADGKTLWFISDRKGGSGGKDVYYATLDKTNTWSVIQNAGKIINTQFDEESPCISGNDKILYFSSKGHSGIGGYDIFYAIREGKNWKKPVNIGYPVNNTQDNTGYIPVGTGIKGYIAFDDPEKANSQDIYLISFKNKPSP